MTPTHDSIRGWFAAALHDEMEKDDKIRLIVADLGWGMWDSVRDDFPDRFTNTGASEQLAVGIGVGMALSGLKPFVYSITTFLLFRAFEWHRNYVNHEHIPVRLVGSGMDDDYKHDGVTHQPNKGTELMPILEKVLYNIEEYYPDKKESVPYCVSEMLRKNNPAFICLRR